jgi:AP-1 complex subunit sigma 1/2
MDVHYLFLVSRQGKVRLSKWYLHFSSKEKQKIIKDVSFAVLQRRSKMCNVIEYKDTKIIYKRYASLYFIVATPMDSNELLILELIQRYVETLDRYFGNVCELDLIFNFHKAYFILDEMLCSGNIQESSKKAVLRAVAHQDTMETEESDSSLSSSANR